MGQYVKNAENDYVYVVGENEQRTDNSFQTASWYKVHALQPGTYPVTLADQFHNKVASLDESYWMVVRIPSRVIDSSFPSTLFGYTAAGPKHVDHDDTYVISTYSYYLETLN